MYFPFTMNFRGKRDFVIGFFCCCCWLEMKFIGVSHRKIFAQNGKCIFDFSLNKRETH